MIHDVLIAVAIFAASVAMSFIMIVPPSEWLGRSADGRDPEPTRTGLAGTAAPRSRRLGKCRNAPPEPQTNDALGDLRHGHRRRLCSRTAALQAAPAERAH